MPKKTGRTAKGFHAALLKAIRDRMPDATDWSTEANSTRYMTDRLVDVATALGLSVCARTLSSPVPGDLPHERREYLFDVTMYPEWEPYSLPDVLVEHENSHRREAFLYDFWKLMMGYAPLRVMIGYARTKSEAEALASEVESLKMRVADDTEDLVMIGHRNMGPLDWVARNRSGRAVWCPLRP